MSHLLEFRDSVHQRLLDGSLTYTDAVKEVESYLKGKNPLAVQALWQSLMAVTEIHGDAKGWQIRAMMSLVPSFQSRMQNLRRWGRGKPKADLSPMDFARTLIWAWSTPQGLGQLRRVSGDVMDRELQKGLRAYPNVPFKAALTEMSECGDLIRQNVARFLLKECVLPDAPIDGGLDIPAAMLDSWLNLRDPWVVAHSSGTGQDMFIGGEGDAPVSIKHLDLLSGIAADQCRDEPVFTFERATEVWTKVLSTKVEDLESLDHGIPELQRLPDMGDFLAGPRYCQNWARLCHWHGGWVDPRGWAGVKEEYVNQGIDRWLFGGPPLSMTTKTPDPISPKKADPKKVDKEDVVVLALQVSQGLITPDRALELWNTPGAMITWAKSGTLLQASAAQEPDVINQDMQVKWVLKSRVFGMPFVRVWNWLTDKNAKGETWNVDRDLAEYVNPDVLDLCTNDESNLLDVFSLALSKEVLQKEIASQRALELWHSRFNLSDGQVSGIAKALKVEDEDNPDLLRVMLALATNLRDPASFLNIGAFSNDASLEGLYLFLKSLKGFASAGELAVVAEVARWCPDTVAVALRKFPADDWRVGCFRSLKDVENFMEVDVASFWPGAVQPTVDKAPAKNEYVPEISTEFADHFSHKARLPSDLREDLPPSMKEALALAFHCSLGALTVTEAAQDLAAYIRYGTTPKDPADLDIKEIPTDVSLRENMVNILSHPLMTSLDAVKDTHLPLPRLHEFDVYMARMNEQALRSMPHAFRGPPTKIQIAIETIKSDAKEIALRAGVRRVRAAIAEKFSAWWSRQNHPRAAEETAEAYGRRLEAGRTQAQAFLGTDMGEASLAMLAGFVWTVVGEDVTNEQLRSFGDAVAREMRVSAGTDILDDVLTEILRPTMAEIQTLMPATGIRVQPAAVKTDEDEQVLSTVETMSRRA